MDPLFFLCQEEYGTYSRPLAHFLKSLNASVLLSELVQRRKYHTDKKELINDLRYGNGWFYETCEKVQERTYLSRKEQDAALKLLIDNDLIEQKNFGVPAKRHFRLKDENILAIFGLSKNHSRLSDSDKLDCPKGTNCIVPNGQTAHIYEEQLLKKKQKKQDAATPAFEELESSEKFSNFLKEKHGLKIFPSALQECREKYGPEICNKILDLLKKEPPNDKKDKSGIFTNQCKGLYRCK